MEIRPKPSAMFRCPASKNKQKLEARDEKKCKSSEFNCTQLLMYALFSPTSRSLNGPFTAGFSYENSDAFLILGKMLIFLTCQGNISFVWKSMGAQNF